MKFSLKWLTAVALLSGCAAEPRLQSETQLIGVCNIAGPNGSRGYRYEIYIRKTDRHDPTSLLPNGVYPSDHSTLVLSEDETAKALQDVVDRRLHQESIRRAVQKDIDSGRALDLDKIKAYESEEKKRFAEHERRLKENGRCDCGHCVPVRKDSK